MKNFLLPFVASSLLTLGVGCIASGQVRGSASVSAPQLIYVSPGVQVIADYDEPIFYTSNFYWRYDGGVWYRSSTHTSGWVRIQAGVPVAILRIERPTAYIHYHGTAGASATPVVVQDQHANHQQAVEERKEQKEAAKEERKEQKEAAKEERKEQKEAVKEERTEQKEAAKDKKHGGR